MLILAVSQNGKPPRPGKAEGDFPSKNSFVMSNIRPQSCTLQVHGSKLVGEKITFILAERQKPTPNKPRLYLLQVLPSGKRSYFSSCYPATVENTFRVEHGGIRYWLALNGPSATLSTAPLEGQNEAFLPNPPNNNRIWCPTWKHLEGKTPNQGPAQ